MELHQRGVMQPVRTIIKSKTGTSVVSYCGPESPLYSAVCPLVYVFRIFGVAPYEFADDVLVPSCGNSIFSFIWSITYCYIIYSVLNAFYYVDRGSPVLGHTETAKTVFNFLVTMINIIISLWTRKDFTRIWNMLQDYDERVQDMGYARNERKTWIFVWSILGLSFIMWTSIHRLGMYAFVQSWWDNVSYMLVYIGAAVSVVKLSAMILLLGNRFHQLNEIAMKNLPVKPRWVNVICVVDAKSIERLYDTLMVAGESLASMYSWSLMIWVFNLSFHIVFNLYFIIDWLLKPDVLWPLVFCLVAWTIVFINQLILLHYACNYASTEANMMGYIMLSWKRWLYTRDRGLIVETSLHLKNRKLIFSAAGCFTINLSLLCSIAALMTTYLVILLQLEASK